MEKQRFSPGDSVAVFKSTSPNQAAAEMLKGIVLGVYNGFLRIRLEGATTAISASTSSCYLIPS